jgi:hypothetical protein
MYYKLNADKSITFLNKYKKVAVAPPIKDIPAKGDNPNGYLRSTWLRGLYNITTNGPSDFSIRTWRGYSDNSGVAPLRYILPIHSSIITSSLGSLKNDGYGY